MRPFLPLLSLTFHFLILSSYAIRIPLTGHVTNTSTIVRRGIAIKNTANVQYTADITVAGTDYPVLLDTGSSDLWVYWGPEPAKYQPPAQESTLVKDGPEIKLKYALGTATGQPYRTTIEFANQTLDNQAFLYNTDPRTFVEDISGQGYTGVFGLGPNTGSLVRKKLKKKNADTVLQNIFNNGNKSEGNYITFLLDRQKDINDPFKGQMTIGELVPGYERIVDEPTLDVETVTRLLKSDQHWQALTDKDHGISGPDGKIIEYDSIVPRAPDGQLVAVIDSGFTFSQVPREVADAIYGRVNGAVYDVSMERWVVPCNQYLNVVFHFGGKEFPIHPLDTVDDNIKDKSELTKNVCLGSFQPITTAFSMLGHYDMILGMNFLRSVYTLLEFGKWIENGDQEVHPYVQMLSLVDVKEAREEFVAVRLGGEDTIDTDAVRQLLPAEKIQLSPVSDEEKMKKYQEMVLSRWPYILLGCLALTILLIGLCIWKCCCKRKKDDTLKGNKRLGFGFGKSAKDRQTDEDAYNSGIGGSNHKGGMDDYQNLGSQAHLPQYASQQGPDYGGHQNQLERQQSHHSSVNNNPNPSYPQSGAHSQQQLISPYQNDYSQSNLELQNQHSPHQYDAYGHGQQQQYGGYNNNGYR